MRARASIDSRASLGRLSMGKFEAPNTGTSSFSMVLGDAPFLDRKYTIFGRVVGGDHVLRKLEKLETTRDGCAPRAYRSGSSM